MINSFIGEYRWLSNFHIHDDGYSVEHYFQAAKAKSANEAAWVLDSDTPAMAKKRGRQVNLRENWEKIKTLVMEAFLRDKFKQEDLKEKLIATGDQELVEGNWWNDTYWGVCNGVGENHLGKLLMKIREEIKNENIASS